MFSKVYILYCYLLEMFLQSFLICYYFVLHISDNPYLLNDYLVFVKILHVLDIL